MTVAARVAQEQGCEMGQAVGYSIRFEDVSTPVSRFRRRLSISCSLNNEISSVNVFSSRIQKSYAQQLDEDADMAQ